MENHHIERIANKKNIATLKAKEIIGEDKLKELLKNDIVVVEWNTYKSNITEKNEALQKIKKIVTSPTLLNPQEEELIE